MNKPKYIIVHHFGGTDLYPLFDTSNQTFEIVNEDHRQKWNFKSSLGFYCGYHYVIDKTGKVTQGRAENEEGAHCIGKNLESIGVALAGNFDTTLPSQAQIESLKTLIIELKAQYNIPLENIVPHRRFANKTCFGRLLADDWVQKLLTVVNTTSCTAERDIIKQQDVKISNLQAFIRSLINLLNKQL